MGPKGTSYEEHKESIRKGLMNRSRATPELQGLNILEVHGELVLRLPERLMFDVGGAQLRPEGQLALTAIADELAARAIRVRIEGHTDSIPVKNAKYASNWELSTARATSVVAHLLNNTKMDPVRLAAAGYAEFHPIASNDTPEGRAQNRRVDIIVVADLVDSASGDSKNKESSPASSSREPSSLTPPKTEDSPKNSAPDPHKLETQPQKSGATEHGSEPHKEPRP
jgi:chemotaxis protein MotB